MGTTGEDTDIVLEELFHHPRHITDFTTATPLSPGQAAIARPKGDVVQCRRSKTHRPTFARIEIAAALHRRRRQESSPQAF